jgi:hypothetical protein
MNARMVEGEVAGEERGVIVNTASVAAFEGQIALLALHVIENPLLNGETIRLDAAIRMAAR